MNDLYYHMKPYLLMGVGGLVSFFGSGIVFWCGLILIISGGIIYKMRKDARNAN